ncbi:MAG: glycosyltransferase [Mucilaginibacter sp.]|nr:glycosyltransferase [Mucilaginibacter sp.]
MLVDKPLNLFYEEPDADRWFKYDRYPRKLIRRIIRGKQKPGGVMLIAINLMHGLDKLGIPYRFNDYHYITEHPKEIACIIGKPHLLFDRKWDNPVILGAGIFSHPMECPDIFERYPNLKYILVPGHWVQKMFEPYYGNKVRSWPVGIDVEKWTPAGDEKNIDFLIYDKIRWDHEKYQDSLIDLIIEVLKKNNLSFQFITYGNYTTDELKDKLSHSKGAIFLCEHETQGQAYQQILATNTPILAWERGGYWQDPYYHPHKVKYQPVSSVPYWDDRCGMKFTDTVEFETKLSTFLNNLDQFKPRDYIIENLTLEKCAQQYLDIYRQVEMELK